MKAAVLQATGGPVAVEEIPLPEPRNGELRIRVAACGLCRSDLHVIRGDIKFPAPCVLGHEISGIVDAVGPGVEAFAPGGRVVASFIMPCGRCGPCARGRDDLCETYFAMNRAKGTLYDGETRLHRPDGTPLAMNMMGGMAEFAIVPQAAVFSLPAGLPLEESCLLGCAIMTAYGAIRNQAELRRGQSVAVVGAGGVGENIIQMARHFGAGRIIAVDVRGDKLEAARRMGAGEGVDASKEDPVARVAALTGGRGVDVAFEALGRPETVEQAFRMTADGGRTVVVGVSPAGAAARIELGRLVRRGIQLMGCFGCRVRADMPVVIGLAARGEVDVKASVTRRFGLAEIAEAYGALERGEIVGRAIVCAGQGGKR